MVKKDEQKKISSAVLDMKFMQRTKKRLEAHDKKKRDQELKNQFVGDDTAVKEEVVDKQQVEFCTDLTRLEDLCFGRMSFQGFNPEVEKLMEYYKRIQNGESSDEEYDDEKDINDQEMADAFKKGSLSAIGKKFSAKADRSGNDEVSTARLNFDPSEIRKRSADVMSNDTDAPARKFLRPE